MSEQAEGGQGDSGAAGAGESTEKGGGEDRFDQLASSLEKFQGDVMSRFDRLTADEEDEEEYEEEELDELDGLEFEFAEDDFDEEGQVQDDARLREIAKMTRRIVQEETSPLMEARENDRRMQEADALEERYPALQDGEYQDKIVAMTRQQAKALGRPELAREPRFLEMVHLQEQARQGAAAEVPAGSTRGATLERGGGAAPADGKSASEEEGDKIVRATTAGRFRLGS